MNSPTACFNRRILVVDDNLAIHDDFRKILGKPDTEEDALQAAEARIFGVQRAVSFEIDTAAQGEEALKRVHQSLAEGRPYAMAFVDMRMPPGWDGIETTQRLWEVCPDLQVVICTAYADYSWSDMQDQLSPLDQLLILKKPFDTIEVLQMTNALTEKWRLLQESKSKLASLEQRVAERTRDLEASQDAALRTMEDAVHHREKAEQAYQDLKREMVERQRLEERFREQASLLDKAQDAIFVHDLEHRITYWNKGAERLYGWSVQEATGRTVAEFLYKDAVAFHRMSEQVARTGEWVGEVQQISKEGRHFTIEGRSTLVRDDAGMPKSVLSINTDITDKKNMEAQLLRSQRLESVGRLSSGVAHDINNILTPMLLSTSMLRTNLPPAEAEKLLNIIETSAQRGVEIIKQLLIFGRGAGGQRAVVKMGDVVGDAVKIMTGTFPKNITIDASTPGEVWPVIGDATQLHQVLLNLCVNARDAMPAGGSLTLATENVRLDKDHAARTPEAAEGPYVLLRVSDTGEGIPPEVIDHIFEPFFTTKETSKGTGLGLATVMGIVKSHNGFVNLCSQVGSGSTFKVYLPATLGALQTSPASAPTTAPPRGQGEMIMVVDDEEGIREVVQSTLLQHGYRVLGAANGVHALELYSLHQGEIKGVLTDIMMPLMDGLAMARKLKELDPTIKIIAASGMGSVKDRQAKTAELRALEITTFLNKPYTVNEILTAVGELVAQEELAAH